MSASEEIKHVLIVSYMQFPEATDLVDEIVQYLKVRGISTTTGLINDNEIQQQVENHSADIFIALGGDGTMLRSGNLCAPFNLPILGINMGRFGFLTEIRKDQWKETLDRLLKGQYRVEHRTMLHAEHWREQSFLGSWEVLNEIVVSRGQIVRPIHLTAYVNERYLTTYVADALIASTATGSTAYAMAAGGPILPPEMRNILLVAVAPHLSIDRPIILAEDTTVSITVETTHQAVMSPDGHLPIELQNYDKITIVTSENHAQFIRLQDPGYFYRNLTPHMNQNPATGNSR